MNLVIGTIGYLLIGVLFAAYHLRRDLEYVKRGGRLTYGGEEYVFICVAWGLIAAWRLIFTYPFRLRMFLRRKKISQ